MKRYCPIMNVSILPFQQVSQAVTVPAPRVAFKPPHSIEMVQQVCR
jgi:hypothetical protein